MARKHNHAAPGEIPADAPLAVVGHNRPPPERQAYRRRCAECGEAFVTRTHDRLFCSDAHKAAFHNRSSKVGRSLVPLAMAWRAGRNAKGPSAEARALRASAARAFSEMCAVLDVAVTDDRAAGRTPKLQYLRRRWSAEGTLKREETAAYHAAEIAKAQAALDLAKANASAAERQEKAA